MSANPVSDQFEHSFLEMPLETQIAHCDHYELAPCFLKWLPGNQPILEAGCGSGRWVAWCVRRGWKATGLDWSEALCERARREIPGGEFVAGDMRAMPLPDASFGAIISLGAVEHVIEGPVASLREYARVLRPGGIAIVTVPYLGPIRRLMRFVKAILRSLTGRNPASRREALAKTNSAWAADMMPGDSGWTFFQYVFTKPQMRSFFREAGLEIIEEFVEFHPEGVLHNFGRLAGRYDHAAARVVFTPVGRLLAALLPKSWTGVMLCHALKKNNSCVFPSDWRTPPRTLPVTGNHRLNRR